MVRIYTPAMQASGNFDGGKITEQKPIGFPGEGSVIKRVGPLFYWAWFASAKEGYIAPHPHSGFEIMTYVTQGKAEHEDSLGTKSIVGPGGAQVMQTGSGVSHSERIIGPEAEGFQIWFEPDLNKSTKLAPTYNEYQHEQFPQEERDGVTVKTVLGGPSPIKLQVPAHMWDVTLQKESRYTHRIQKGHTLSALAIRGGGRWEAGGKEYVFQPKDFSVIPVDQETEVAIAAGEEAVRILLIEVPSSPDYALYPKR
ncbi:pirin family protein [Paenibacillus sp. GD4]|jgi:quercetin 2,3-dioxygenase|uniref:pirin family protein n=1 Tax=Paenibacillus sp. GD4 TaxID=3068890 RepID=UPI002796CE72|nr:pirin family protein [Paenibacillus sp. GD4]MDQ1912060.1 pirin family protein [Paenibacillus sp. GD4]